MKKEISFNVNQSFQKTVYGIAIYSMLFYFTYLPPTEKQLKFEGPASRRRISSRNMSPNEQRHSLSVSVSSYKIG